MGKFKSENGDSYQIVGQNHCTLREFESNVKDEGEYEVVKISSLQDISNGGLPHPAIPFSDIPRFNASDVWERMNSAAPDMANNFALKANARSKAPFKLIKECQFTRPQSFIALSYCWHNTDWRLSEHLEGSYTNGKNFSWPISEYMTKALLLERVSSNEGIWVDQCCIDQTNNEEKLLTIGFMDAIYKQARLVIVALEDIAISEAEEAFLEDLMDKYNQEAVEGIRVHAGSACDAATLSLKIFSARWFSRAWCSHEFLVSHNHVFLIRVERRAPVAARVLRVTADFLKSLTFVTTAYISFPDIEDERSRLLVSRYDELHKIGHMRTLIEHVEVNARLRHNEGDYQPISPTDIKSFLEVFLHYSSLGASVEVDKLVITLNILGCELYFRGTNMEQPECGLCISILALAAGDPTVLCSSGEKFKLSGQSSQQSWLQWPQQGDFDGTFRKRTMYRRLDYVPEFSQEQVTLDLFVFGNDTILHRASEPFMAQAVWFVDGLIEVFKEDFKEENSEILQSRETQWILQRDVNIKILACALECGLDWFERGVALRSFPYPGLQQALHTFFSDGIVKHSFRELYDQNRDQWVAVTDVIEAMTEIYFFGPLDPAHFPAWIEVGPNETDKILIMCPDHDGYTIAIPALLLHEEYTNCKRIFFLDAVSQITESWNILGKTAAFGADLTVLTQHGVLRQNQRLLG